MKISKKRSCNSLFYSANFFRETSDTKVDAKVDNEEEKTNTTSNQTEKKEVSISFQIFINRVKRKRKKRQK